MKLLEVGGGRRPNRWPEEPVFHRDAGPGTSLIAIEGVVEAVASDLHQWIALNLADTCQTMCWRSVCRSPSRAGHRLTGDCALEVLAHQRTKLGLDMHLVLQSNQ